MTGIPVNSTLVAEELGKPVCSLFFDANLRFLSPIPVRMMENSCAVDDRNRKDNRS
jgi:hypothetical protein